MLSLGKHSRSHVPRPLSQKYFARGASIITRSCLAEPLLPTTDRWIGPCLWSDEQAHALPMQQHARTASARYYVSLPIWTVTSASLMGARRTPQTISSYERASPQPPSVSACKHFCDFRPKIWARGSCERVRRRLRRWKTSLFPEIRDDGSVGTALWASTSFCISLILGLTTSVITQILRFDLDVRISSLVLGVHG